MYGGLDTGLLEQYIENRDIFFTTRDCGWTVYRCHLNIWVF